jgi:hypothetical protein
MWAIRTLVQFLIFVQPLLLPGPAKALQCFDADKAFDAVGFSELKAVISRHNIRDSNELFSFFSRSDRFRRFLIDPVLLRTSSALNMFSVSGEFPRILLQQGNLTLHLTANPSESNAGSIEIVEFLPKKR